MSISKRLRDSMVENGFSEGELARRSGVPQPTINRILSGESSSPRRGNVVSLARALGKTAEWLFLGGEDESAALHPFDTLNPDPAAGLKGVAMVAAVDGMALCIRLGDRLIVDTQDVRLTQGVFIIDAPGVGTVARRFSRNLLGDWDIRCDNPDKTAYPDQVFMDKDIQRLAVLGRVVWRAGPI